MTSILKVSTIQNTAGGAPTAADLGLNITGSVLQVQSFNQTSSVAYSASSAHKILEINKRVSQWANLRIKI